MMMKLKTWMRVLLGLTFWFFNPSFATGADYFPPERLNCKLNASNKVRCEAFNRQFLTEDATNADLKQDQYDIFYFVSAVAYISRNDSEASVFYTYNNKMLKMVRLRSVNNSIRPNFNAGSWKKFNEDIYICDAGYMRCPIVDTANYNT